MYGTRMVLIPSKLNRSQASLPRMYLTAAGNRCRLTSPATLLPLVLLLEPLLQGLEVLEQRAPVHLPLSRHRLERVRPRLARAHRQHLLEPCSRLFAPVEGAL